MSFLFRDLKIPGNKELRCALQHIWGIGWNKSLLVSTKIGAPYPISINNLSLYYYSIIIYFLDNFTISSVRIKRTMKDNILFLQEIGSYKGARHIYFLPVHGQRTRTNAGTMKNRRDKGSL